MEIKLEAPSYETDFNNNVTAIRVTINLDETRATVRLTVDDLGDKDPMALTPNDYKPLVLAKLAADVKTAQAGK